jgi:nitrate reductase gamma subunit
LGGEKPPTQRFEGRVMLEYLDKAKQYLWSFVEVGFLTVLAVVLIYLILGADSGVFVSGVADNVLKFAAAIPSQSLVGLAIVLALVFLIARRRPNI